MSEKKMDYVKIEHLGNYVELLLKAQDKGMKLTNEISLAFKQIERELDLDGSSYVLVQNGEVHIKNCTFNPSESEGGSLTVKANKLSFNGLDIGNDAKISVRGNTFTNCSTGVQFKDKKDIDVEKLVEKVYSNGKVNSEVLRKLNDMSVAIEFSDYGIRWYYK